MILTKTSSREIRGLDGQPRAVHNSGVWFTDPDGKITHRMDFEVWESLGSPVLFEFDADLAREAIAAAQADIDAETKRVAAATRKRVKAEYAEAKAKLEAEHAAELAAAQGIDGESLWR